MLFNRSFFVVPLLLASLTACGVPPSRAETIPDTTKLLATLQAVDGPPSEAELAALGHCDVAASLAYLGSLETEHPLLPAAWRGGPAASSTPNAKRFRTPKELLPLTGVPLSHRHPETRAAALAQGPFDLVLGSGYFGMFEHLGFLRALARLGLEPRHVTGISSGALVAGLSRCTSLPHTQDALLGVGLTNFADFSWNAYQHGSLLEGRALRRKLAQILLPYGMNRLEQCPQSVSVLAFNLRTQRTVQLSRGAIPASLSASAALPKLFMPVQLEDGDYYIDGGWLDPHGALVLQPGNPTVVHRLMGLSAAETRRAEESLGRPSADESLPSDLAHQTAFIDNPDRFRKWNVFWQLGWNKGKLRRIVTQHEACALSWLLSAD
jgi:hypothetical protein